MDQSPTSPKPDLPIEPVPEATSKHPQDEYGHFIRKDPQVSGLLHTATTNDDETLIDVKVNNPLHKITQLLQQIKSHQSTTVSMRFTIPLIALPIVLLAAFQLGRVQTTCSPVFTSQVGNLQILSLQVPKIDSSWYSPFVNLLPGNFIPQKTIGFTREDRAVLLTQDGNTLSLLPAKGLNLSALNNMQVIVSGEYSACNKAITIDNQSNIKPR
ncbi:MAG: hypothetical protein Q8O88_04325 [bacterium]|nr:hypothetical protein [bacterium]